MTRETWVGHSPQDRKLVDEANVMFAFKKRENSLNKVQIKKLTQIKKEILCFATRAICPLPAYKTRSEL